MFKHADAELAFVEIELDDKPKWVLIIKTPLSLWPMSQDYSEDRVSALAQAAEIFKLKKGLDDIRMISTRKA